jgi:hypothetical protein
MKTQLSSNLDKIQEQVVIGSLLGDGSLASVKSGYCTPKITNNHACFRERHGIKQTNWTWWKYSILKNFCKRKPT